MVQTTNIQNIIGSVLRWIFKDRLRPKIFQTLPALGLLILSPFFSTAAFLLLPIALFSELGMATEIPFLKNFAQLQDMAVSNAVWLIPCLFLGYGVSNYIGHNQILQFSMRYQKRLADRVSDYFYTMVRDGKAVPQIDTATIRKLIMGDSRYLARVYMSLYLLIPQLVMATVALAVLLYLVPRLMLALLLVFAAFVPANIIVASQSQKASSGFLKGAAKLSQHLPGALREFSGTSRPHDVSSEKLSESLIGEQATDFFDCFETRTRMGYVGGLVSNVALAVMLIVLVLLLPKFVSGSLTAQVSLGVILLIAARYFFAGVTAIVRLIVAISNTFPYYSTYLKVFTDSQWDIPSFTDSTTPISNVDQNKVDFKEASTFGIILAHTLAEANPEFVRVRQDLTLTPVYPLSHLEWRKAKDKYSTTMPDSTCEQLWSLDMDSTYTEGGALLLRIAQLFEKSAPETVTVFERDWRRINQKRRIQVTRILNNAGAGFVVLNSGYREFCLPRHSELFLAEPTRESLVSVPNNYQQIYATAIRHQNFSMNELNERRKQGTPHLDIYCERTPENWASLSSVFERFRTVWLLSHFDPRFTEYNLSWLHKNYPTMSDWWDILYEDLSNSRISEAMRRGVPAGLDIKFIRSLAIALNSRAELIVLPYGLVSRLKQAERPQFYDRLAQAGVAIAVIRTLYQSPIKPFASRGLVLSDQGVWETDEFVQLSATPKNRQPLTLSVGDRNLDICSGETLGVVANQPLFDWMIFEHFKAVMETAAPRLFEQPTLLTLNALSKPSVSPFILDTLQSVDFAPLSFSYPKLDFAWEIASSAANKLLSSRNDKDGDAGLSLSEAFYLSLASALQGEPRTLYIREDDFRSIPQKHRELVVDELFDVLIVIWKNHLRTPFIKPRSKTALLVNNEGLIGFADSTKTTREIPATSYRRLIQSPFQGAIYDVTNVFLED